MLDLLMPVMDGFTVLDQLQKDPDLQDIPVLILTNLSLQEKLESALRPGKDYFLTKTSNTLKDIVQKANSILSRSCPFFFYKCKRLLRLDW